MTEKTRADNVKSTNSRREIGKGYVDRIVKSRTFEPWYHKPIAGCRFWRPKQQGDKIQGLIFEPVVNFRQSTSYPVELDNGEKVEVVGNKQLHHLIKQADCFGQRVEIIYCGRQYLINGHYRKIYRLFKIDWDNKKLDPSRQPKSRRKQG